MQTDHRNHGVRIWSSSILDPNATWLQILFLYLFRKLAIFQATKDDIDQNLQFLGGIYPPPTVANDEGL